VPVFHFLSCHDHLITGVALVASPVSEAIPIQAAGFPIQAPPDFNEKNHFPWWAQMTVMTIVVVIIITVTFKVWRMIIPNSLT